MDINPVNHILKMQLRGFIVKLRDICHSTIYVIFVDIIGAALFRLLKCDDSLVSDKGRLILRRW